jgi:hypothetical protein
VTQTMRIVSDEFVAQHEIEDLGQHPSGWFFKLLSLPTGDAIVMRPPNGKLWRGEIPDDPTPLTVTETANG